jgi:hypothetical protein
MALAMKMDRPRYFSNPRTIEQPPGTPRCKRPEQKYSAVAVLLCHPKDKTKNCIPEMAMILPSRG